MKKLLSGVGLILILALVGAAFYFLGGVKDILDVQPSYDSSLERKIENERLMEAYARYKVIYEDCLNSAKSMKSSGVAETGEIKNDFNGEDYPNNYRIINGDYFEGCGSVTSPNTRPIYQQIVYVDTNENAWTKIWEAPNDKEVKGNETRREYIATSSISVLPGGRYVSFYWMGYEWGGNVLFDLKKNTDAAKDVFADKYPQFSVPVVSESRKTLAFYDNVNEFAGEGWPRIWLAREFDPLVLRKIFNFSTTSDGFGPGPYPVVTDLKATDKLITFVLKPNDYSTTMRRQYTYSIDTGELTKQ